MDIEKTEQKLKTRVSCKLRRLSLLHDSLSVDKRCVVFDVATKYLDTFFADFKHGADLQTLTNTRFQTSFK
nr:hypothetical protein [Tanacetum cinerariifolium]